MITRGVATELEGTFVVVGGMSTLAYLRPVFAAQAQEYGFPDFDTGTLRVVAPRAFTQEISAHLEQQIDPTGTPYAGISYLSRHGDDLENWAIFERTRMNGASPVLSVHREAVDPEDEDFHRALALLGLALRD
jgi:hypothetical protein